MVDAEVVGEVVGVADHVTEQLGLARRISRSWYQRSLTRLRHSCRLVTVAFALDVAQALAPAPVGPLQARADQVPPVAVQRPESTLPALLDGTSRGGDRPLLGAALAVSRELLLEVGTQTGRALARAGSESLLEAVQVSISTSASRKPPSVRPTSR